LSNLQKKLTTKVSKESQKKLDFTRKNTKGEKLKTFKM